MSMSTARPQVQETHATLSDTATSLVGSAHGLHRKHMVRNIGIQYEQSACAVHKAVDERQQQGGDTGWQGRLPSRSA